MFREIFGFIKINLWHLLLVVPGALAVTIVHEAAHSFAAWVQGGTITEFVWLPSEARWGYMMYEFPPGASYSSFAISVAPYVLWACLAAISGMIALRPWVKSWPSLLRSFLFVWLFFVPLSDIANAAFPYVLNSSANDLYQAFGAPTPLLFALTIVGTALAAVAGYFVQKPCYAQRALSPGAYAVLTAATLAAILVFTTRLGPGIFV